MFLQRQIMGVTINRVVWWFGLVCILYTTHCNTIRFITVLQAETIIVITCEESTKLLCMKQRIIQFQFFFKLGP